VFFTGPAEAEQASVSFEGNVGPVAQIPYVLDVPERLVLEPVNLAADGGAQARGEEVGGTK
jgi:hypothetical protein